MFENEEVKPSVTQVSDKHAAPGDSAAPLDARARMREQLIADVHAWIDELGEPVDVACDDEPDLYSFYESLCAVQADVKSSSRKSHETLARFGDALSKLDGSLGALREDLARMGIEKTTSSIDARDFLFPLTDMRERLRRISGALSERPPAGLWGGRSRWITHVDSARKACGLVEEQLEKTLAELGVRRATTEGAAFDPRTMIAVGVDESGTRDEGMVAEEISAGYFHNDTVLKPAEVTVARALNRS